MTIGVVFKCFLRLSDTLSFITEAVLSLQTVRAAYFVYTYFVRDGLFCTILVL